MKDSLYYRIVLGVIAFWLTVKGLQDFKVIPTAQAAGKSTVIDVNIQSVSGQYLYDRSLPVHVVNR